MKKLHIHQDWLKELLPQGLSHPSSTLISGPGGSGKPLIGFALVYDWLKAGGQVIFIPLQYPETKFVETSLKRLYDLNVNEYPERISYIQFDHSIDNLEKVNEHTFRANLLKPGVWDKAIDASEKLLTGSEPSDTLVFASALNLLLFSPTYKKTILNKIEKLLKENEEKTYLFNVSTSAFRKDIAKWENAVDNLMFARMEKPMNLYLRVEKMKNNEMPSKEVSVPIEKEMLEEIKEVAESVRKRKIPKLQKI